MLAFKLGQKHSFYKWKVAANIYDQWISDDGSLCAFEACSNSKNFFLISLKEKKLLFKKKLEIGRFVNEVNFLSPKEFLIENEYGEFRYDCNTGELLDEKKWYACYIQGLKNKILKNDKYSKKIIAKFYRQIGETYQKIGDEKEAIIYYRKALENDPKVGVKLRLKKLT